MIERSDLRKIGKYISFLRKRKGYTQKELGELIDVNDKTISKWEQGTIAPDITILIPLSKVLDTSLNDLLSGGDDINIEKVIVNKKKNKRITSIILSIIFGIIIGLILVTYIQKYYKVDYKEIKIRDEFVINGFIVTNKDNKYLVIKDIIYESNELGTEFYGMITKLEVTVENNGKVLFRNKYLTDDYMLINDFFNHYLITLDIDKKTKDDNYIIRISFIDSNDKTHGFNYNF